MKNAAMEHQEMRESLERAIETAHRALPQHKFPPWTRQLSLSTAVIAVLTAISSLGAEYLSHHALLYKNEMVFYQAKASDQWAYFQSKSVKGIISDGLAVILETSDSEKSKRYRAEANRYKTEQIELKKEADAIEAKIHANNERAERCISYHHAFSIAVTLFQVAIALSAIAVLIWRRRLWHVGLAIGTVAATFLVKGLGYFL